MLLFSIYNCFKIRKWIKYSPAKRQKILEKVEKKQAKKLGRPAMPVIIYPREDWQSYGMFMIEKNKTYLYLNKRLLTDTSLRFHALESLIHEGRHAYQYMQITKKKIKWYNFKAKAWKHNYSGYISSNEDKLVYGMQPVERDAQKYTIKAMQKFSFRFRNENDYIDTMNALIYRYENTAQEIKEQEGIFYRHKINKKIQNKQY